MFEVDAFITTDGKNKGTSMARYIGRAVRDMRQYGDRDRKQPTVIGFASLSGDTQRRVNCANEVFDEQVLGANHKIKKKIGLPQGHRSSNSSSSGCVVGQGLAYRSSASSKAAHHCYFIRLDLEKARGSMAF